MYILMNVMVSAMSKLKDKKKLLINNVNTKKNTLIIYVFLRTLVVIEMIISLIRGNYEHLFLCFLTLILFMIPSFIEKKLCIELPSVLEVIILLFIFAAEILGEIGEYYVRFSF